MRLAARILGIFIALSVHSVWHQASAQDHEPHVHDPRPEPIPRPDPGSRPKSHEPRPGQCNADTFWAACDAVLQCFYDPKHEIAQSLREAIKKAAKDGDGNGVGSDGIECGKIYAYSPNYGTPQWDNWTEKCDNGNYRELGFAAWDAFQAHKQRCAPPSQWRHN